jgi:predicted phosphoadenosine phosphosulfate sulfurtransferase
MDLKKINIYITKWKKRGYKKDIPDEIPEELINLNLAPSYKAICIAILKNDHSLSTLGFTPKKSEWYNEIKKQEIKLRNKNENV